MTSTLGFAVLGLLARNPLTGYELANRLKAPVGYFWAARHSQIYPELARLEDDGLVTHAVVPGPGPRDNKRYSLTSRGRARLRAWVVTEPSPTPAKSELLLRVYSIWLAEPGQAREMLEKERARHADAQAAYARILESDAGEPVSPDSPAFGDLATLHAGVAYEDFTLGWIDWLLERLAADPG